MEQRVEEKNIKLQDKKKVSIIEKIGKKIPDPVIIFAIFYVVVLFSTLFLGGKTFEVIQLILLKICLKQKIFNGYFQMHYLITG